MNDHEIADYEDYLASQAEDHKDRNEEFYCDDEAECDDPFAVWCDPVEFMPEMADAWVESEYEVSL